MTFQEKQAALLLDLIDEKVKFGEQWSSYYDRKIADLKSAIAEGISQ